MRRRIAFVPLLFLLHVAMAQHLIHTKATFVIRDDFGQPVINAPIEGGFRDVSNAGARDRFKGMTDTNGIFIAEGDAMIGIGCRVTSDGYYETIKSVPIDTKSGSNINHWEVQIPVLLKRARSPIPITYAFGPGRMNLAKSRTRYTGRYTGRSTETSPIL